MPSSTTPPTPSLLPFTSGNGVSLSSGGGDTHPFRACGPSLPPWTCMQRKLRSCFCQRHGSHPLNQERPLLHGQRHPPRAPNQSTQNGWAKVGGKERGFLSHSLGFNLLSLCCFLFFWKYILGDSFSWMKFTSLSLPFLFILVDCYMVHCPSFESFA